MIETLCATEDINENISKKMLTATISECLMSVVHESKRQLVHTGATTITTGPLPPTLFFIFYFSINIICPRDHEFITKHDNSMCLFMMISNVSFVINSVWENFLFWNRYSPMLLLQHTSSIGSITYADQSFKLRFIISLKQLWISNMIEFEGPHEFIQEDAYQPSPMLFSMNFNISVVSCKQVTTIAIIKIMLRHFLTCCVSYTLMFTSTCSLIPLHILSSGNNHPRRQIGHLHISLKRSQSRKKTVDYVCYCFHVLVILHFCCP